MSLATLAYWGCILAGAIAGHAAGGWMTELQGAAMGLTQYWLVLFMLKLFVDDGTLDPDESDDWPITEKISARARVADFIHLTLRMTTFPLSALIALPRTAFVDELDAPGKALLLGAVLLAALLAVLVLPVTTWKICALLWVGLDF